jgi:hypothetical protein
MILLAIVYGLEFLNEYVIMLSLLADDFTF